MADYLMWVGGKFYTVDSFCEEAERLGVCKRIATIPDDLILNESKIFLCHDEELGKGYGYVFGFFIPTSVDLILTDPEKIRQYEALKDEVGIRPVPAGIAAVEPERGCGHRMTGALYIVSDPAEWEKLYEATKPLADKLEVKGGIVVLKHYLPYSGPRFRGYKKIEPGMIPPLDDLGIERISYHTEAARIKVRPFFIE